MPSLAIVGTAGRGSDADALSMVHWETMLRAAKHIIKVENVDRMVSGGAAWADHVAVRLFLEKTVPLLGLHLPAFVSRDGFVDQPNAENFGRSGRKAGEISTGYHRDFSTRLNIDSLEELSRACAMIPNCSVTIGTGFNSRNLMVASDSDMLLAMTFGHGRVVKPGGTERTVRAFLRRTSGNLAAKSWHLDLNTLKLYTPVEA